MCSHCHLVWRADGATVCRLDGLGFGRLLLRLLQLDIREFPTHGAIFLLRRLLLGLLHSALIAEQTLSHALHVATSAQ